MLLPLYAIAALANIIAKAHNFNIYPEENENFDLRVKRYINRDVFVNFDDLPTVLNVKPNEETKSENNNGKIIPKQNNVNNLVYSSIEDKVRKASGNKFTNEAIKNVYPSSVEDFVRNKRAVKTGSRNSKINKDKSETNTDDDLNNNSTDPQTNSTNDLTPISSDYADYDYENEGFYMTTKPKTVNIYGPKKKTKVPDNKLNNTTNPTTASKGDNVSSTDKQKKTEKPVASDEFESKATYRSKRNYYLAVSRNGHRQITPEYIPLSDTYIPGYTPLPITPVKQPGNEGTDYKYGEDDSKDTSVTDNKRKSNNNPVKEEESDDDDESKDRKPSSGILDKLKPKNDTNNFNNSDSTLNEDVNVNKPTPGEVPSTGDVNYHEDYSDYENGGHFILTEPKRVNTYRPKPKTDYDNTNIFNPRPVTQRNQKKPSHSLVDSFFDFFNEPTTQRSDTRYKNRRISDTYDDVEDDDAINTNPKRKYRSKRSYYMPVSNPCKVNGRNTQAYRILSKTSIPGYEETDELPTTSDCDKKKGSTANSKETTTKKQVSKSDEDDHTEDSTDKLKSHKIEERSVQKPYSEIDTDYENDGYFIVRSTKRPTTRRPTTPSKKHTTPRSVTTKKTTPKPRTMTKPSTKKQPPKNSREDSHEDSDETETKSPNRRTPNLLSILHRGRHHPVLRLKRSYYIPTNNRDRYRGSKRPGYYPLSDTYIPGYNDESSVYDFEGGSVYPYPADDGRYPQYPPRYDHQNPYPSQYDHENPSQYDQRPDLINRYNGYDRPYTTDRPNCDYRGNCNYNPNYYNNPYSSSNQWQIENEGFDQRNDYYGRNRNQYDDGQYRSVQYPRSQERRYKRSYYIPVTNNGKSRKHEYVQLSDSYIPGYSDEREIPDFERNKPTDREDPTKKPTENHDKETKRPSKKKKDSEDCDTSNDGVLKSIWKSITGLFSDKKSCADKHGRRKRDVIDFFNNIVDKVQYYTHGKEVVIINDSNVNQSQHDSYNINTNSIPEREGQSEVIDNYGNTIANSNGNPQNYNNMFGYTHQNYINQYPTEFNVYQYDNLPNVNTAYNRNYGSVNVINNNGYTEQVTENSVTEGDTTTEDLLKATCFMCGSINCPKKTVRRGFRCVPIK